MVKVHINKDLIKLPLINLEKKCQRVIWILRKTELLLIEETLIIWDLLFILR